MVNEPACEEAVAMARDNPKLGVGLHLALSHGRSALAPEEIPGLVNAKGEFSNQPVEAGMRYYFRRDLQEQLRREIHAQLQRFRATGLPLDHVNGHLHFHLHPAVFRILMDQVQEFGVRHVRLTRDPFWLNARLSGGEWISRGVHAFIYLCLSGNARGTLRSAGIRHTRRVFGLLQNGRVNEEYIMRLLPRLPDGDSELYSHPSLDEFKSEFDALVSDRVTNAVRQHGIKLIRYQDL
jgi:hopanoid biosynthesis associated protein HpnK